MDPTELLDYALGRLDGPRRARLERLIADDPGLAARVARLIRNLDSLLDDGQGHCPPKEEVSSQSPPPSDPA
ncbi:hypothetical protein SAMN05444166_6705 [Singulisphaera sp. GP187]|uniref:hypothetical protein n=1 Tax=Singulisphaera sp. GP187 TaxID=1882752 RepID=UPI00092B143C|nr:hypothetical protein [Singulisphaera sp. GP187]SIO61276.1 hypothetical protein SAMN05444166_6705 [Singulisphaera sp. GP187]